MKTTKMYRVLRGRFRVCSNGTTQIVRRGDLIELDDAQAKPHLRKSLPRLREVTDEVTTQCAGMTKSGGRCQRKVTKGRFCPAHILAPDAEAGADALVGDPATDEDSSSEE